MFNTTDYTFIKSNDLYSSNNPLLPNDNLTWETTTQTNAGLDFGFLNDKYRVTLDYYVKNTTSLLATVQLPPSSGYNTIIDNVGEVENKGFELEIGTDLIATKDLRWSIDANLSINKNKVVATKNNLPFSQLIFEGRWVHVAFNGKSPASVIVLVARGGSAPYENGGGKSGSRLPPDLKWA